MEKTNKNENWSYLKNLLLVAFFTLGCLLSIAFFGLLQVEKDMKNNLAEHLQTTLNSNVEILNFWFKEKRLDAQVFANDHELVARINQLIDLNEKASSPEEVIKSQELQWFRDHLGPPAKKYGFAGFVLFDTNGLEIGALMNAPVGQTILKDQSDFFQRALKGDTIVSTPFRGEVSIPDEHGILRDNWPTMFVATPIKNKAGEIKAVLSFRIRPETEFSELLHITRFGESGETYVFSPEGLMFSDSRFNQQLREVGLISPEPWSHSILNVYIRDPKGNLTKGFKPTLPKKDWPLTQMAASATLGGFNFEVQPYNDYRGVPVVGAWTWLAGHGMGVTSEIDASEALQPVYSLRRSFYALCVFLSLAFSLGIFFRAKQIIAEKIQRRKELQSLDEELKTRTVLDNVVDAIITIDQEGIIQSFNQGAKTLFQYDDHEVLGQNIKMLMPDPDRSQHDEYLKRYLSTKTPHIIGMNRELVALKKDGTEFPIDLAVSQVNLHDRVVFAGVIRDISQRKEFESALIEAKQLADDANQSKSDFLANMSHEIRTPMNGIIGLTHLAMKMELTPIQHDS